jgi:PRTRC genetic system protein B
MTNITETLGSLYHPQSALLIYESHNRGGRNNVYVEAYDIGIHGNPINAHPLTVQESIALAKALDNSAEISRSFLKPKGLIPSNVLYINPEQDGFAIWHTPAMTANLFFKDELDLTDGTYALPPLVWKAAKNRLCIYALKSTDVPDLLTVLYDAPFFNIYDDGRVCMGDVKLDFKEHTCLEEFMAQWQGYFFNSRFSHLLQHRSPVKGNIIQLYKNLAGGKKKFPQGVLLKNGLTLENLLR